jgi:hypothetical protein
MDFLIYIIITLLVLASIYYFIQYNEEKIKEAKIYKENFRACDIDKYNLDDMMVIKRTPEYSRLIDGIIDKKSFIFNDNQIKNLKNPQQIFNLNNLDSNTSSQIDYRKLDVDNISQKIYTDCKTNLDVAVDKDFDNKLIDFSNTEYDIIKNQFKKDIQNTLKPNCYNTDVLKKDKYLRNYYKDVYGNRVKADLVDYFADYYTNINNESDKCIPVETQLGKSNFLIPDQYNTETYFTNAYNIDWSRMINPLSYSA